MSLITPTTWKCKLIHVLRELGTEPALAVLDLQPDLGLSLDHLAELGVGEEHPHPVLVVALDDERLVELGVTHLDVLHPQQLAQVAEEALAVDRESEALGVHVRGAHAGVGRAALPGRLGVRVEGDRPRSDADLDLAPPFQKPPSTNSAPISSLSCRQTSSLLGPNQPIVSPPGLT